MPPIKNWSRADDICDKSNLYQDVGWKHDNTGEVVCMTTKVPNDGYYGYRHSPDDEFLTGDRDVVGFGTRWNEAKRDVVEHLRENPKGLDL